MNDCKAIIFKKKKDMIVHSIQKMYWKCVRKFNEYLGRLILLHTLRRSYNICNDRSSVNCFVISCIFYIPVMNFTDQVAMDQTLFESKSYHVVFIKLPLFQAYHTHTHIHTHTHTHTHTHYLVHTQ